MWWPFSQSFGYICLLIHQFSGFMGLINQHLGAFSKFGLWSFSVIKASRFATVSTLSDKSSSSGIVLAALLIFTSSPLCAHLFYALLLPLPNIICISQQTSIFTEHIFLFLSFFFPILAFLLPLILFDLSIILWLATSFCGLYPWCQTCSEKREAVAVEIWRLLPCKLK